MTDFEKALAATLTHEGGYANVAGDKGGETYRGISRRYHPDWPGWPIIDGLKARPGFAALIKDNPVLDHEVKEFYRVLWNDIHGDDFDSQEIAEILFDTAVNSGPTTAVRILQQALNLLNRDGKSWPELTVDGVMGAKTLWSIEQAQEDWKYVVQLMRALRVLLFIKIMTSDPGQEKFARGWLERAGT